MRSAVTLGNFDGVHLGHRALVHAALSARDRAGSAPRSVAMFFDPHPTAVMAPDRAPRLLTSPARRADLLRRCGIDQVDIRTFDESFAQQSPEAFVSKILVDEHRAHTVVVGDDFRFGAGREGDVEVLRELAKAHGFDVLIVDPVHHGDDLVSSTRIRAHIEAGEVAAASVLLARFHDVTGTVVKGDQRGRTIGFPTANLATPDTAPCDGVYAVLTKTQSGARVSGVANLGVRPTFEAGRSVEVHLLDFEGDLYGTELRVAFVARLRGEQKFDGLDALRAQLSRDVAAGREALAGMNQDERALWI